MGIYKAIRDNGISITLWHSQKADTYMYFDANEALAQEINEQHQERMAPFTFSACGIAIGEQIEFFCNGNDHTGELCEVVDDKHVAYNGETWSLTALAKYLTGVKSAIAGPRYFKYKGEWLNTIRHRLGV